MSWSATSGSLVLHGVLIIIDFCARVPHAHAQPRPAGCGWANTGTGMLIAVLVVGALIGLACVMAWNMTPNIDDVKVRAAQLAAPDFP